MQILHLSDLHFTGPAGPEPIWFDSVGDLADASRRVERGRSVTARIVKCALDKARATPGPWHDLGKAHPFWLVQAVNDTCKGKGRVSKALRDLRIPQRTPAHWPDGLLAGLCRHIDRARPLYIIVTGDVCHIPDAKTEGVERLRSLVVGLRKKAVAVPELVLVPGNHDIRRVGGKRLSHYRDMIQALSKALSTAVSGTKVTGVGDSVPLVTEFIDGPDRLLVFGLDSCLKESESSAGLGYLGQDQLERLERKLEDHAGESFPKIVVLHHHLVPVDQLEMKEKNPPSVVLDTHVLLTLMRKHGIRLVLHGHRHNPVITQVDEQWRAVGSTSNPQALIIGAGSACAWNAPVRQFGLYDITGNLVQVRSFEDKGRGWRKSFDHGKHFGLRPTTQGAAREHDRVARLWVPITAGCGKISIVHSEVRKLVDSSLQNGRELVLASDVSSILRGFECSPGPEYSPVKPGALSASYVTLGSSIYNSESQRVLREALKRLVPNEHWSLVGEDSRCEGTLRGEVISAFVNDAKGDEWLQRLWTYLEIMRERACPVAITVVCPDCERQVNVGLNISGSFDGVAQAPAIRFPEVGTVGQSDVTAACPAAATGLSTPMPVETANAGSLAPSTGLMTSPNKPACASEPRDLCVVIRLCLSPGNHALLGFGATAPGTFASLCGRTQERIVQELNKDTYRKGCFREFLAAFVLKTDKEDVAELRWTHQGFVIRDIPAQIAPMK